MLDDPPPTPLLSIALQREKLADVQMALNRTEQELAREREENVQMRAKAKAGKRAARLHMETCHIVAKRVIPPCIPALCTNCTHA